MPLTLTLADSHGLGLSGRGAHQVYYGFAGPVLARPCPLGPRPYTCMACYGVLWHVMVCHGVLWCVMLCYGVLWRVMACYGVLCFIAVHCVVLHFEVECE